MIDELALRRDLEKAARAKALVENETLNGAFDTLEDSYIRMWKATGLDATREREQLYMAVRATGAIRMHLEQLIGGGELAKADLDRLTKG